LGGKGRISRRRKAKGDQEGIEETSGGLNGKKTTINRERRPHISSEECKKNNETERGYHRRGNVHLLV